MKKWIYTNKNSQTKERKEKSIFFILFLTIEKNCRKKHIFIYILLKLTIWNVLCENFESILCFFLRAFLFICFDFLWIKLYWFGHLIDSVNRFSYRFVWKINEGHVKSHVLTFNYYGLFICICQLTCSLSWSFSLKCQGLLEPNTTILFWERRKGERGLLLDRGKRK